MCLTCSKKINIVDDLTVYKVFYINDNNEICSPIYSNCKWNVNETKSTNVDEPDITPYDFGNEIEGNAIHSFKSINDATSYFKNLERYFDSMFAVYECVIPKTSKFLYEGKFGTQVSYASEKLTPIKQIM